MISDQNDFVIYLSSRENTNEFPCNRAASFTNKIIPGRILDGEYEVALQNIIFKPQFDAILKNDRDYTIKTYTEFLNADGNSFNATNFTYKPTRNITGDNLQQAVHSLNNDYNETLIRNRLIDKTNPSVIFRLNPFDNRIKFSDISPPETSNYSGYRTFWNFSDKMSRFLGLTENKTINPAFADAGQIEKIECLYVYSDIIYPSNIGNQAIHILDIIPTDIVSAKNTVSSLYKHVNKNVIDNISIKITSEHGKEVPFNESVSILAVLHFRLRQ